MIRYYTHQRRHFLKISFLILLILFSMLLAAVTYYRAISIWLCMALIIVDYVMVIFSSKKSGRVSTYNGHVVTICDSQYDLNNPVQINENQKWCEFYYSDLSIRIPLSHELMKNIDIKNASVIMMKPIHYLRVAFANVLFIFFFYDVFCLLFGIILLLKGYQLLLPSLMIMRGIALILFFIGFFCAYVIKNQKLSSYLLCFLGVIAILLPMFTSLKTYEDFYGKIYCQANQSQLKIYADVQGEYGMLKKTLKNVQKYEICELHQKQILFYQQNHVESYLAYPESSQMTAPEIVKPYQGIQYGNNEHSLSFVSQGIIVDGELCPFQQIDVVNDNMLKINGKSQMCYAYFSKIQYHKGVKILFPFETPSFLSAVSQSDAKQTVSQTLTSQEQMNKTSTQHSNKTDVKSYEDFLNAVKNVQSFTSNHTIVKIHTKSQDKNKIVKDVAKTLTIMNNDKNMRIDTQILKIEIIAGDDLEFVARVYDRQDCENEEKQLHNYILRIKKVDNSYIGVRVEDNTDISMNLKSLKKPIITDTSFSTDYLYCIQGKKEVDGW